MAWDWNESGRTDTFEFEKISCKNLNTKLGKLECLVTGGTLTFSYNSDLKVSGTLNVINAPSDMAEQEYLIRVFYTPSKDGEKKRIELGTFYFTANLHYENGMYKGTIDLRSLLARHIDDLTCQKWTLSKNETAANMFKKVFKALGGFPKIEGITNKKQANRHVFDVGVTPMSILQYIADMCGGEITVNSHGQTVLRKYITPANKAKSVAHTITANAKSVVLPGLDVTNSIKTIPNRVVCVYEQGSGSASRQYVGKAALAATEARSYQKTGRWVTVYYKLNSCATPYVQNLQKKAKSYLAKANHKTIYYEFDTYYQPIEIGEVIQLKYDKINVKGLVTNIDLRLEVGAPMHVTIRKV